MVRRVSGRVAQLFWGTAARTTILSDVKFTRAQSLGEKS